MTVTQIPTTYHMSSAAPTTDNLALVQAMLESQGMDESNLGRMFPGVVVWLQGNMVNSTGTLEAGGAACQWANLEAGAAACQWAEFKDKADKVEETSVVDVNGTNMVVAAETETCPEVVPRDYNPPLVVPTATAVLVPAEDQQQHGPPMGALDALEVPPRLRGKKRGLAVVKAQFSTSPSLVEVGKIIYKCIHCGNIVMKARTCNATRLSKHVAECNTCPEDIKNTCAQESQVEKKRMKVLDLGCAGGSSLGSQSLDSIVQAGRDTDDSLQGVTRSIGTASRSIIIRRKTQMRMKDFYQQLSEEESRNIIGRKVETVLARFEPVSRFDDPFCVHEIMADFPGMHPSVYPVDSDTIYMRHVLPIDKDTRKQLSTRFAKMPGHMSIGQDGVTINGNSNILYTCSKGEVTMFQGLQQLGEAVHVTDAEVEDATRQIEQIMDEFGNEEVCTLAVDNAAQKVAGLAAAVYMSRHPGKIMIVVRDPSHCIDLPCKDFGSIPHVAQVLDWCTDMIKLVNTDRIAGIKETMVEHDRIVDFQNVHMHPETRFYLLVDSLHGVIQQRQFLTTLPGEPEYVDYYNGRTAPRKESLDSITAMAASPVTWTKFGRILKFATPFKTANKMTSSDGTPMSAYYPIVQATRNGLNSVLGIGYGEDDSGSQTYHELFGGTAAPAIKEMVSVRFNMDGSAPGGRKVGLIDPYQIFCFLIDPYARRLQPAIQLFPSHMFQVNSMIRYFVPGEGEDVRRLRETLRMEFMQFEAQTGVYADLFMEPRPPTLNTEDARLAAESLTFADVNNWVEATGKHEARITWWECSNPNSPLYLKIGKPLLSIRTTGSITVERVAKPLKNKVLTKERNRLNTESAAVLLRAGINLRLLSNMKVSVKKTMRGANEKTH